MAEPTRNNQGPDESDAYGQRSGDGRQQPWPGADTQEIDRSREPNTPLADRVKPQVDGVRSGPDEVPADRDRARDAASVGSLGLAEPRKPVDLVGAVDDQPNSADEMNSVLAPSDPSVVREAVLNTSTSSGLHPEDEAAGQQLKEQYRHGGREISPID